jgi:hypothetical protein
VITVVALTFGQAIVGVLASFPLAVLSALLVVAAVAHIALLRDLRGGYPWAVAIGVGVVGITTNLAWAVGAGLVVDAAIRAARRRRGATSTNSTTA